MVWLSVPILNQYPLYIIPYSLLLFILTGYALLNVLKPGIYKKVVEKSVISVNLSIIITVLVYLAYSYQKIGISFYMVLSLITVFLTVIAVLRRNSYSDTPPLPASVEKPKEIPENVAVSVDNVSMEFNLSKEKVDNIKEYFIKLVKGELMYQEFWALHNISFQVEKGGKLGIIGLNGAGKSTILKLISGVMKPTIGTIKIRGSIVPLLELGGGFDSNYTGRENIFLRGALLGYTKDFMESKYDEIVEFSELEEFIDVPIKNYSSGMKSKLGFAISTIVQPEILILDEVLAAGDAKFRKKSEERMNSLLNKNTTLILVSHSMHQVRTLCDRAIWLEKGRMVMDGPSKEVCDKYMESIKKGD